jgi:hypothetical protein
MISGRRNNASGDAHPDSGVRDGRCRRSRGRNPDNDGFAEYRRGFAAIFSRLAKEVSLARAAENLAQMDCVSRPRPKRQTLSLVFRLPLVPPLWARPRGAPVRASKNEQWPTATAATLAI